MRQITLNSDQERLITATTSEGIFRFIGKNELSAIARNKGLPLSVVHSLTMNPDLATNDPSIIILPNINGTYDPDWLKQQNDDKITQFAKLLPKKVEETEEDEKPKIFYQVKLDKPDPKVNNNKLTKEKNTNTNIMKNTEKHVVEECTISIPETDPLFVPFGIYDDVEAVVKSGVFHPIFITGLSGNGKTFSATEACARLKRQCVRVPITVESDEDSLLGGFRLIDGNTVFQLGPIPEAMLAGAVVILDEVDKASSKIMCLQPVLEGQPIYLKRINRMIHPAKGFNVIATANTKGQGSEIGNFVTSLVLDEAFLERFALTVEQDYPDAKTEQKILRMLLSTFDNLKDDDFIKLLVEWAGTIRKGYKDGSHSSVITTRRLCHIIKNYAIFGQNKHKSVEMSINRFDTETKTAFYTLWTAKCPIVQKGFSDTTKSTTTYANNPTGNNRPF